MSTSKRIHPTAAGGIAPAGVPEDLHKIKAAAQARGLSEEYLRRIVEERRIPSWKIGKYRMLSLEDLDRYIARGFTPAQGVGA